MPNIRVIGHTLDDKYRIEKLLGKGGMGTVYLATHVGTERPVAVKVIAPEFMKRAEFVERFRREARAAGRLRHPNVVDVTDFGFSDSPDGEVAYLVMEYLDGCTLGEILSEEKRLPLSWTVDILEQVCSAVSEAHEQGIIHRDLKPDNIWLEPNQRGGYTVKVLDFGIAKLEESTISISERAGFVIDNNAETMLIGGGETIADSEGSGTAVFDSSSTQKGDGATMAYSPTELGSGTIAESIKNNDGNEATKEGSLEDDETKLIDTGGAGVRSLARTSSELSSAELTRVGAVLGTPLYMSPEQCRGDKLTPQSDIYSLGVIAYQMLSGDTPFSGDYSAVMEAHKSTEPPTLSAKKVPKKVKQVIHSALAKETDKRPQTAEGFASELRANSEGLGTLLRRALVIYSEHITKFLWIAILIGIPSAVLTMGGVTFRFLAAIEVVSGPWLLGITTGVFSFLQFFTQIFAAALLVGMSTWIVAQVLAAPLRPISIRASFRQVGRRWKPLFGTVTLSTLISIVGLAFCLIPGVWLSAKFMLIAPSIVMENVSGRAAFKRSMELAKRSFRTVLATAILVYVVPSFLAIVIALSLNGIMNTFDPPPVRNTTATENSTNGSTADAEDVNFRIDGKGFNFETKDSKTDESMARKLRNSVQQGLYELLWIPISVIIVSFSSVITALLYFKTRQAGGESMLELLSRFEEDECPKTNWQARVRERLMQSGRTSTGKKILSG